MSIWEDRNFGPMLLSEVKEAFDSDEYIFELKFDGTRALIFVSSNGIVIKNRHLQDITYLYPELQSIKNLVKGNVIFDGEIVSFLDGVPSFRKLQERAHLKDKFKIKFQSEKNPVMFIAFDILYEDKDITGYSLLKRKKRLNKYKDSDYFIKNMFIEKYGTTLFKKVKKLGLEGIVAKISVSKYYINKRTTEWIKIKNLIKESFYIGGYVESNNKTISLLLGEFRNNKLFYVGRVVMSLKESLYKKIKESKKKEKTVFEKEIEGAKYITPKLKCFVEYMERTKTNHLRQPVFRGEDK